MKDQYTIKKEEKELDTCVDDSRISNDYFHYLSSVTTDTKLGKTDFPWINMHGRKFHNCIKIFCVTFLVFTL